MKLSNIIPLVSLVATAQASIILYGICQTACNVGLVTCVTAVGMTMDPAAMSKSPRQPPLILN